jgi:dephospho-CoA kinase
MTKMVIGLTGLIGSGKSTVARIFAERGAQVVDTDVIAHQLTIPNGFALPAIQQEFGSDLVNSGGVLDRVRLREMVFNDEALHQRLEKLMHPLILAETRSQLMNNSSACYSLVVVPLLFRAPDYLAITDRNIFVDTEYQELEIIMEPQQVSSRQTNCSLVDCAFLLKSMDALIFQVVGVRLHH